MPAGRPTMLSESIAKRIIDYVRAGNYIETAAKAAGIHRDTLHEWMKRGAKERRRIEVKGEKPLAREAPYLEFSDTIEKAMGEAEARDVLLIGKAAESQWQAAAWRLERKFSKRWAKTERHELTGKHGKAIEARHDVKLGLSDEGAEMIRRKILGIS